MDARPVLVYTLTRLRVVPGSPVFGRMPIRFFFEPVGVTLFFATGELLRGLDADIASPLFERLDS